MTAHNHPDVDRITFGCDGCIARAEQARWDNAPRRHVTWHCTCKVDRETYDVRFTIPLRVPDGATGDDVDYWHAGETGEAFVLALPDDIDIDDTTWAMETMEVVRVVIGDLVDKPAPMQQESLL